MAGMWWKLLESKLEMDVDADGLDARRKKLLLWLLRVPLLVRKGARRVMMQKSRRVAAQTMGCPVAARSSRWRRQRDCGYG